MAVKGRKERNADKNEPTIENNKDSQIKASRSDEFSMENGGSATASGKKDKNSNKCEKDDSEDCVELEYSLEENIKLIDDQNDWEEDEKPAAENSNEKTQKEDSSIFIGNAPIGIKVEKIKAHFIKYGKIKKCTVIKDRNTNIPFMRRTYPPRNISAIIYIDFTTEAAARNACEENQKMFEGKRLRVSLARERKPINKEATLFVGNLKYTTSEEQLYDEFIEFGDIDMVRIIAGKGFGFVHFADAASVDRAAVKNKSKFNGREIHVERSRPPIQKDCTEQESIDRAIANQNHLKKQQAPGGYLNYRRNQTRNQLALELLERVINVQCKRPKSGIKF